MAHHIVTKKFQRYSKQDDHILPGKYDYRIRCKECGPMSENPVGSEAVARLLEVNHRIDVENRHARRHPNDAAHARAVRNKQRKANTRG